MAANDKAIGYLELNSRQFDDAISTAKKALIGLGTFVASYKIGSIFKEGISDAIKFGNEAYFAAQKLNGYDPGKLLIATKALQTAGQSAEEARGNIQDFALSARPLETLFKGGSAGLGDALNRAAKEYGTQASVLSQSAEKFAFVQMQLDNVGTKLQGFFLGLADKVAGPLSALLAEIDKVDLVGIGEKFGGYIVTAIQTVKGLMANGNFIDMLKLGSKIGFQEAANYLLGAVNTAVDILTNSDTWAGIGTTLIGVLGIVGSFMTSLFLGIGKILIATVQSAIAQLQEKYPWFKTATEQKMTVVERAAAYSAGGYEATKNFTKDASPAVLMRAFNEGGLQVVEALQKGIDAANKKNNYSTDVSENLKSIEGNSAIQAMNKLTDAQLATSKDVAKGGLFQLSQVQTPEFKKAPLYDTSADTKLFKDMLAKAQKQASEDFTKMGKVNPVYSERADPIHIIADSLAKVGGGGRYVRTGLSIKSGS